VQHRAPGHQALRRGRPAGRPDVNRHNVVENNHVHHCGRLVGHGYGVRVTQSGHNRIVHNHIHHMPRYATTIKGLRYLKQSMAALRAGPARARKRKDG